MIRAAWTRRDPIALVVIAPIVVLVAGYGSAYWLYSFSLVAIYAILAIGFNVALGQAGQVSFAQVAFMAIGAYSTGVLTTKAHLNPVLALLAGVVLGAALSALVNLPLLRLRGHYLGMATLALALGVQALARNLTNLTGGAIGLSDIPPLSIGDRTISTQPNFLILVWVLCGVCLAIYHLMVSSHYGRSWRAIASRLEVAASLGVDVARYRLLALVIAGAMAALAGSLYAEFQNYVSPDYFGITMIGDIFFMVIVGGMGTTSGPVLGAMIIVLLPDQMSSLGQWQGIVVLAILLACLVLLPAGLLGDTAEAGSARDLLPAALRTVGRTEREAATR